MADRENKKGFKPGVYALFAGVIVAVVLVLLTIFAFTTRYTAFSPEKVAQAYTDTIVQTGDGYDAYKNTLVSKNQKYGDFIIDAYMLPYINEDAKQNELIGSGSDKEAEMLDKVYNDMYDYYVSLLQTYGMDDYDTIYTMYFAKLAEVRQNVIGDDYMDTDFMFGVFESNVQKYGESLTGTEEELADDDKTVLVEASTGKYQEMYGKDYKLTATVSNTKEYSADEVKTYIDGYKTRIAQADVPNSTYSTLLANLSEEDADTMKSAYAGLDNSSAISAVDECTVDVTLQDGTKVASVKVYVVEIGNSWYVDNTNENTSALYLALNK